MDSFWINHRSETVIEKPVLIKRRKRNGKSEKNKTTVVDGTNTDLNSYTQTGLYHFDKLWSAMTNALSNVGTYFSGILRVTHYSNAKILQDLYIDSLSSAEQKPIFTRMYWNSSWTAWIKQSTRYEVDAINSKLSDTGWQNTSVSGITYRNMYGICFVNFNLATTVTTSWQSIVTLPSGNRPRGLRYFRCIGSNGVGNVSVSINTDGSINARVESGTGSAINGLISFDT